MVTTPELIASLFHPLFGVRLQYAGGGEIAVARPPSARTVLGWVDNDAFVLVGAMNPCPCAGTTAMRVGPVRMLSALSRATRRSQLGTKRTDGTVRRLCLGAIGRKLFRCVQRRTSCEEGRHIRERAPNLRNLYGCSTAGNVLICAGESFQIPLARVVYTISPSMKSCGRWPWILHHDPVPSRWM
jgi:hypothetical protein